MNFDKNKGKVEQLHSCRTVVFATGINQFYLQHLIKEEKP